MKILIYGAGVIGSVLGAKLTRAGNEVTVLARGKRLEEIRRNGIILVNPKSGQAEMADVKIIEELKPEEIFDYIFVTMQRTQVDSILPSLSRNMSKNIVFFVNTAGGYEKWAKALGDDRLMLGFPSAGGVIESGKVSYFIGRGLQRVFQTTTLGEYRGVRTERTKRLIKIFNKAGIPSVFCSDMDSWQKTHVALVTNIANALYGFDCNNFKLGSSYIAVKTMVKGIKEGREVLRRNGLKPIPGKLFWMDMPLPLLTIFFLLFMRTDLADITMARHCKSAIDEMIMLQEEFDELIRSSGFRTPAIESLKNNLASYRMVVMESALD